MLQAYVINVASVSDVCCSKCFMLQVFHEHAWQGAQAEVVPSDVAVPTCARESKVGVEDEASSMDGQQTRSTR